MHMFRHFIWYRKFHSPFPIKKLEKIKQLCLQWTNKTHCTKKQLQSFLGALWYVSKCIKVSWIFLSHMLYTLWENYNNHIHVTPEFKKDINWFLTFLPQFSGITFVDKRPIQATIEFDACLTSIGFLVYNKKVYPIISNTLSAIKTQCKLHGLDCVAFSDKCVSLFIKSLKINRPFRASLKHIISLEMLKYIGHICGSMYLGFILRQSVWQPFSHSSGFQI